jgi:MFS family permease
VESHVRILAVGVAIRTFGAALYNPFLALFLYSVLHVGYLEIGAIFVVVGGIQLPFGLAGGLWTDRVGRRKLIILGLATEAVLTATLAYAFDIRSLVLAVVSAAVGGALLAATGAAFSAYIADWTSGSGRTRAFTLYRITFNAGFAAGAALGGILVEFVGFTGAVVFASIIIAGATAFVLAFIPPSPFDQRIRDGARAPDASAREPARNRSLRESLSVVSRDRVALLAAVGFALVYLTSSQWNVTFGLFSHNKLGISYTLLGIGFALNGVIVVVGQSLTTESLIGRRHTTIGILGGALYAGAYLVLGASALGAILPNVFFLVCVLVLTVGENVEAIPTSTLPSNLAPAGEVGSYNGAFTMFLSGAGLAAIFVGGAVLSAVSNPLLEWVLLVLPVIPGVVLLRIAGRRIPLDVDRA